MFSLIITIISIALVAALALATIYYGGTAFNKSASSVNATKLLTQSQQVLAADRLYRVDHEGQMPPDMQALIDGNYLKTIPSAQIESFATYAANSVEWQMIASAQGRAYSYTSATVDQDTCKEVNRVSFGQNGILKNVVTGFKTQCYGDNTDNTVLVVADPLVLTTATLPRTPTVVEASTVGSSDWFIAPSEGSGGGSTPATSNTLTETSGVTANWGTVALNSYPAIRSIVVKNNSTIGATLFITNPTGFLSSSGCPATLDPGASCTYDLRVATASALNTFNGDFVIGATGPSGEAFTPITIAAYAKVQAPITGLITIEGSSVTFGAVSSSLPTDMTTAYSPSDVARKFYGQDFCAYGNYNTSNFNAYNDYNAYVVIYFFNGSGGCDWAHENRIHIIATPTVVP